MAVESLPGPICIVGRYALYGEIASGGMATVHIGRLRGAVGFARIVAIKRLHANYARDPDFVSMFVDEARLAARIRHPNVVQTIDIVENSEELFLVMEYVHGESLQRLMQLALKAGERVPHRIVAALISGALRGLHAAHETTDERGQSLGLVHRDVSPQNILVGLDGMPRLLDFGVARASGQIHTTQAGRLKGKLAYMSPELVDGEEVQRAADIYSAGVVLWELLTSRRLFRAENQAAILSKVLAGNVPAPSQIAPGVPDAYDAVILKALARQPSDRYQSAREFAEAVEACAGVEAPAQVGAWVERVAGDTLNARAEKVSQVERSTEVSEVSDLRAMVDDFASGSWSRSGIAPVNSTASQDGSGFAPAGASRVAPGASQPRRTLALGAVVALVVVAGVAWVALDRTVGPQSTSESKSEVIGAPGPGASPPEGKRAVNRPLPASLPATESRAPDSPSRKLPDERHTDPEITAEPVPAAEPAPLQNTVTETVPSPAPAQRPATPRKKEPVKSDKPASPFSGLGGRL